MNENSVAIMKNLNNKKVNKVVKRSYLIRIELSIIPIIKLIGMLAVRGLTVVGINIDQIKPLINMNMISLLINLFIAAVKKRKNETASIA
jgi:hypothetical protein